jgi:hypothetical protein
VILPGSSRIGGAGDFELSRAGRLVAHLERLAFRLIVGTDRAGDVTIIGIVVVEHFLRPRLPGSLPGDRRIGHDLFVGDDDLGIVRHALRAGDLHVGLVAALHPFSQRIAAVEYQTGNLEREQADRGQQHDRDQPEIARKADHAARPPD